jgi:diketogulonate reductase-like aldo/keto reductase
MKVRHPAKLPPLIKEMTLIGQDHGGKSNSQVALNWVICKGALPIPGAKNADQAAQNAGALSWRLSADDVATLDAAAKFGQRGVFNRVWQHG